MLAGLVGLLRPVRECAVKLLHALGIEEVNRDMRRSRLPPQRPPPCRAIGLSGMWRWVVMVVIDGGRKVIECRFRGLAR